MSANSVDSDQYVDASIDLAHMAADSVDDTKVGNRVPALTRRQGGSATLWNTEGTTTYTPTTVRMQCGCIEWIGSAADTGDVSVTFPVAFGQPPLVFLSQTADLTVIAHVDEMPGAADFDISWFDTASATYTSVKIMWLAIGEEA